MRNAGQICKNGKVYCNEIGCDDFRNGRCKSMQCEDNIDRRRNQRVYKNEIRKALMNEDHEIL